MTKTAKILLITGGLAIAALATYAQLKKKKTAVPLPAPPKPKKTSSIVVGDNVSTTPADQPLTEGVDDPQHVIQLQDALNELHQAAGYINTNCSGIKWPTFAKWATDENGNILNAHGVFDSRTTAVSLYYLNKTTVTLDQLTALRAQLSAWRSGGDKCKYPLGMFTGIANDLGNLFSGIF